MPPARGDLLSGWLGGYAATACPADNALHPAGCEQSTEPLARPPWGRGCWGGDCGWAVLCPPLGGWQVG